MTHKLQQPQQTIMHLDNWFATPTGQHILKLEQQAIASMLINKRIAHSLLIGCPQQHHLLDFTAIPYRTLLSPVKTCEHRNWHIMSYFDQLPLMHESLDLLVLSHVLEFCQQPEALLADALKAVAPEQYVLISGFNPVSRFGLQASCTKQKGLPWQGAFRRPKHAINLLQQQGFEMVQQRQIGFSLANESWLDKVVERYVGCFANVYLLLAQKKLMTATPVKQSLFKRLLQTRSSRVPEAPASRAGIKNEES